LVLFGVGGFVEQGFDGGDQAAGDEEQFKVEGAGDLGEGIEAGNDLAGFDAGDMHLGHTDALAEFGLAPAAAAALLVEG